MVFFRILQDACGDQQVEQQYRQADDRDRYEVLSESHEFHGLRCEPGTP